MSDSGQIQNLGKAQISPRHQSIGKNGSFWLPKDSPNQIRQSQTGSKSGKQSSPNAQVASGAENNAGKNSSTPLSPTKASFAKTILSAEKKISSKILSPQNTKTGTAASVLPKSLMKSNVTPLPVVSKGVKGSSVNPNTVLPPLVVKEEVKPLISTQLYHKMVFRDTDDQNQGKKNKHHGTKNAQIFSTMDSENKDKAITSVASTDSFSQSDTSVVSKFVNFIGKSVCPRVAYANKYSKKVVRFAIDLPNGGKLGVRLEKSENGISMCFIAPDEDTRALLDFCKKGLKDRIDEDQSTKVQIHVFSDYKQMDKYFKRAA
jgi:hypothetical protein